LMMLQPAQARVPVLQKKERRSLATLISGSA
jgi:hypothetical protein